MSGHSLSFNVMNKASMGDECICIQDADIQSSDHSE
jgi:hypothetical protein